MQSYSCPSLESLFSIEDDIKDYLFDKKFSTGIQFDWQNIPIFAGSRYDLLPLFLKDKNVLHFGFADHFDEIENKMSQGRWLHGRLIYNCKHVVGIDVDEKAVNFCKMQGINNIYALNILDDLPTELLNQKFDYILCADVIEHLSQSVKIFSRLRELSVKLNSKCLVTTPNAWSLHFIKQVLQGKETVNTDHLCLYSPYTLLRVLALAGFQNFSIGLSSLGIEKALKFKLLFTGIKLLSKGKYDVNVMLGHDLIVETS